MKKVFTPGVPKVPQGSLGSLGFPRVGLTPRVYGLSSLCGFGDHFSGKQTVWAICLTSPLKK